MKQKWRTFPIKNVVSYLPYASQINTDFNSIACIFQKPRYPIYYLLKFV